MTSTAGPLVAGLAATARAFVDLEGWRFLGFARLDDFAREKLDRSGRWIKELAALGKRMQDAPPLLAAVLGTDGEVPLPLCAALKIARAPATHPIEHWIDLGRRVTIRELEIALDANGGTSGEDDDTCGNPRNSGKAHSSDEASNSNGTVDANSATRNDERDTDQVDAAAYEDPEALAAHGVQVRVSVERPFRSCFYETLDLHRAVTGMDSTIVSFVEALCAEASAGLTPPDATATPLNHGIPADREEQTLARVNDRWRALRMAMAPFLGHVHQGQTPPAPKPPRAEENNPRQNEALIAKFGAPGTRNDGTHRPSARVLEAARMADRLSFSIHVQDHFERELGELLHSMSQHGDWTTLGFRCLGHYARERLGIPQRTAQSRAKLAHDLRQFPIARAAYNAGLLGREAARILVRFLPAGTAPELEERWVAHAKQTTVKRLRDELQMLEYAGFESEGGASAPATPRPADAPEARGNDSAASPGADPLDVSGDDPAAFPRRPPTDEEWRRSLHREPGRTRRRLQRCKAVSDRSASGAQDGGANVFLSARLPADLARLFLAALESARQRLSALPPEPAPGDAEPLSHQFARAYRKRGEEVSVGVALLALLEDYALTWDDPAAFPKRRWHLTYVRDGWRCMAPGCTSRRRMDAHHIDYRSHQGSNELWNLLTLCRYHHQQGEHGGYAQVRGEAPDGVLWRLGAPGVGEWYRNEIRCAA